MIDSFLLRVFNLDIRVALAQGFTQEQCREVRASWSRCLAEEPESVSREAAQRLIDENTIPSSDLPFLALIRVDSAEAQSVPVQAATYSQLCESLVSTVTLQGINANVGKHLMFHAAGLADEQGRAIALVAPSGTGKTTASRVLGKEFSYLTDETVFLDGMTVLPYPKPLSIIEDPSNPKAQRSPDDLKLQPTAEGAELTRIVLLKRVSEEEIPDGVAVELLGPVDALHRLAPQISGAPSLPDAFRHLMELVTAVGGVYEISYADAEMLLPVIRTLLSERAVGDGRVWEAQDFRTDAPSAEGSPQGFRRTGSCQACIIEERCLILLDTLLIELSPVGEAIWETLASPKSLDDIVQGVTEILGEHPDAHELVETAFNDMRDRKLILGPED